MQTFDSDSSVIVLENFVKEQKDFVFSEVDDWTKIDLDRETQYVLAGKILHRRTGALAQSVRWDINKKDSEVKLVLMSGVPYARIHEKGGTIKAKAGHYLTIPFPAAMTAAGMVYPARSFKNTFVVKSRAGNLIIMQDKERKVSTSKKSKKKVRKNVRKKSTNKTNKVIKSKANKKSKKKKSTVVPLFLLKKQVKIPKREWATKAVEKALPDLYKRLDSNVKE